MIQLLWKKKKITWVIIPIVAIVAVIADNIPLAIIVAGWSITIAIEEAQERSRDVMP